MRDCSRRVVLTSAAALPLAAAAPISDRSVNGEESAMNMMTTPSALIANISAMPLDVDAHLVDLWHQLLAAHAMQRRPLTPWWARW